MSEFNNVTCFTTNRLSFFRSKSVLVVPSLNFDQLGTHATHGCKDLIQHQIKNILVMPCEKYTKYTLANKTSDLLFIKESSSCAKWFVPLETGHVPPLDNANSFPVFLETGVKNQQLPPKHE